MCSGLPNGAMAQSLVLSNLQGDFQIAGQLLSYNNQQFVVETRFGRLTVPDRNLICQGQGCPDPSIRPGFETTPNSLPVMIDR